MPADDVSGHANLARSTGIPIAVGESLYSIGQFRSYLETGAASIMQPDVARVGGISPWMKIAHLCEAFNVGVAPHYVMELSVSLVSAVSNGLYVEHVPELEAVTTSRIEIELPHAIPPAHPGLGIQWKVTVLAGT
jgi:L-alanine-DL-glutamate epimerase-like enolase superfamily enzyme